MIIAFGSLNMDLLIPVPTLPEPGETVLTPSYATAPGGKSANQAVAAARAGGDVTLVGCVGRDAYGDELLEIVSAEGVDSRFITAVDMPSGVAVVAVADNGENQIIACFGANGATAEDMVNDDLLHAASSVLLTLEVPLREVFALAQRAHGAGKRVILNAAPAGPIMPETLDILIANEIEARQIGDQLGIAATEPVDVARSLAATHGLTTIVTLGGDGAVAITPDGGWRVGAPVITPRDTTGAGDAFCGVLAAALDGGADLPAALRRASVAGALTCLEPGAMPALPRSEAIERRLNDLAPATPI
ncbi:MAG: ribokinase [Pseudomonadota bacterium]